MDECDVGLSARAATILGSIAEGRSYDQILQRHPDLTYFDIFGAVREALDLLQAPVLRLVPPVESMPLPVEHVPDEPAPLPIVLTAVEPASSASAASASAASASAASASAASASAESAPAPPKRLPAHIERARATHSRAWARWSSVEDARLTALFEQGASRAEMVRELERQPGAIRTRLLKLGLMSEADAASHEDQEGAAVPVRRRDVRGNPEMDAQSGSALPSPVVSGWEAFRDRLLSEGETP